MGWRLVGLEAVLRRPAHVRRRRLDAAGLALAEPEPLRLPGQRAAGHPGVDARDPGAAVCAAGRRAARVDDVRSRGALAGRFRTGTGCGRILSFGRVVPWRCGAPGCRLARVEPDSNYSNRGCGLGRFCLRSWRLVASARAVRSADWQSFARTVAD